MAPREMLVLLSGPVVGGKTTLRQALLLLHGFGYVRSSGYLKKLAEQRGLGGERPSLQDLGDQLDQRTDYRWLLDEVAIPEFTDAPDQRRWLVDAVRKHRQVEHFRGAYGSVVLHVHLTAGEDVLRRRYAERGDPLPYDVAIRHENEVASRSLIGIANLVIDTGTTSPEEAARQIVVWRPEGQLSRRNRLDK